MIARRASGVLLAFALLVASAPAVALNLFPGTRPTDLGFAEGRFTRGDERPNWVASTVDPAEKDRYVAPIAFQGDAAKAWSRLERVIAALPRATIVARTPDYLHVEFASRLFGFVDDTQFALDVRSGVIHVKSAARVGIRDFSVNRDRVEAIRAAFAASPE